MFNWNHTEIRLPCWPAKIKFKDRYWGPATAWVRIVKDEKKIEGEFSEVVQDICSNHRYRFISDFSNNCRKCVNPLSFHKTSVKTSSLEITLEEYSFVQVIVSYWSKNMFLV